MRPTTLALALFACAAAHAKTVSTPQPYQIDGDDYEGRLIYDDTASGKQPGLVLVPNWMGINDGNLKQAEQIAARGYVVFVADMYGKAVRPKDAKEAGAASGAVKKDLSILRQRVAKAHELLLAASDTPLNTDHIGAIGFCFGGTVALELARSGADVDGVVSFHGGVAPVDPADGKNIKGKVLALHGADDPYVPADQVKAFEDEMRAAKVDWQLVSFGNAVHSFTDVDANMPGQAQYNAVVAARAYEMMDDFYAELFAKR